MTNGPAPTALLRTVPDSTDIAEEHAVIYDTPSAGLAAIMSSARDARVFAAPVPHGIPRGSV